MICRISRTLPQTSRVYQGCGATPRNRSLDPLLLQEKTNAGAIGLSVKCHIRGTYVGVEEPSTASTADISLRVGGSDAGFAGGADIDRMEVSLLLSRQVKPPEEQRRSARPGAAPNICHWIWN